nr:MAG: HNH endonuclease [Bacteriophage sp.]
MSGFDSYLPNQYSYKLADMTYRNIDPKLAGIYIIKNNLNGKCYIGQSVKIRSRIKDHMRNAKNGKLDLPIYRAINKYGFHNFTIDILESFIPDADMTNTDLIKQLDQLEIKYIEEYNAYTDGYNCTKGGDFGVLGLKMTEEQKRKVSENSKKLVASGVFGKRVYLYNFVEKYYIYAWTIKDAASITKLSRSNIGRLCNNTYIHPFCNNFIAASTKEELEDKKSKIPEWLEEYEKNKATLVERHRNGKVYFGNSNWIKGMVSPNKGKKMSEEQKEKLRIASTKYLVYQYTLDNILVATYIGMHNAAKSVNTDYKSIQRACNGRAKTCKGYIWKKELMQSDCKQTA